MKMISFCKKRIIPSLIVMFLLVILAVLSYLFIYLLVILGLDPKYSVSCGQMLFILLFVISVLLVVAGVRFCCSEVECEDNLEAVVIETSDDKETGPPAYEDVLQLEEKACPSFNQATRVGN